MTALFTIAVVAGLALGQGDAGLWGGRIDQTPHNFFGPGARPSSADEDLCEVCHVPNRLRGLRPKAALWSPKETARNAALDVAADPSGPPLALRWSGSTLRCLSCHDGTVSGIAIVFRPASGSLRDDPVAADKARARGTQGPAVLWPDAWMAVVMGNHPVSVPYPLDGQSTEFRDYTARAAPLDPRHWVADPRMKGLKLLPDTSGFDLLAGTAGVECVSCHDPHGTTNTHFLRLPKERSELCLGCHRK